MTTELKDKKITPKIIKTTKTALGPYTVHEVENEDGTKAWGLSIKSFSDKFDTKLGDQISVGRAIKKLTQKLNKEKSRNQTIFSR